MNWRRGLFRVWAALTLLWLAISGFVTYPDVLYEYGLTKTQNTYDVALPDGRAIKIVSPADAGAAALAEIEKKFATTPRCKKGACDPWELEWDESGVTPLPGATVDAAGHIAGPYSIVDHKSHAEAEANLTRALKSAAIGSVLPPAALGLALLVLAWVASGFRSARQIRRHAAARRRGSISRS
jgi:hypothetical protein